MEPIVNLLRNLDPKLVATAIASVATAAATQAITALGGNAEKVLEATLIQQPKVTVAGLIVIGAGALAGYVKSNLGTLVRNPPETDSAVELPPELQQAWPGKGA